MSTTSFHLPREATIQLSDVFGPIDTQIGAISVPPPDDFDARITAQVRNTGHFHDGEYSFSDGGNILGNYGAVLVDDLRSQQREKALEVVTHYGYEPHTEGSLQAFFAEQKDRAHPDNLVLAQCLGSAVILIDNSAPRNTEHQEAGRNGATFYVATTSNSVEVYAQAHLLSGLDARGRIQSLYRIPEDGSYWPIGEQFRSSIVSDARRHPEALIPVKRDENWPVPKLPKGVRFAYTDKFGNVRIETSSIAPVRQTLDQHDHVDLVDVHGNILVPKIHVVSGLQEIPEHEFGIYGNPADNETAQGPAYLELVRRVNDCNGTSEPRAYHELSAKVGTILGKAVQLSDWGDLTMQIVPSS